MSSTIHPSLFQINTRVWLRRFDRGSHRARLVDVPDIYWDYLSKRGIDYVWLMGIWPTSEAGLNKNIFSDQDLHHYQQVLPDLSKEDIIGSPYAIDRYLLNPDIATESELKEFRAKLNARGIGLFLDFVPNHFGAHSKLLETNPEFFLNKPNGWKNSFPEIFFKHDSYNDRVFAHGKDPYFGAWRDTVQVNYCEEKARSYMADQLLYIASLCDGVRCDMTMIVLNRVFKESWGKFLTDQEKQSWQGEFWSETIFNIKEQFPDFLIMAECYWNLEMEMLQLGFDYSYDKSWTDQIKEGNLFNLVTYLSSAPGYLQHTVHFLENHDEERIANVLPKHQAEAAAVLLASMPGMRFYHQGQWEGRQTKIPVQLGREPEESSCTCLLIQNNDIEKSIKPQLLKKGYFRPRCHCNFEKYDSLLRIFSHPVFKKGQWKKAFLNKNVDTGLYSIIWSLAETHYLIIINYASHSIETDFSTTELGVPNHQLNLILNTGMISINDDLIQLKLQAFEYCVLEFKSGN